MVGNPPPAPPRLTLPPGHSASVVIASVSGGKDSTALLCVLRESEIPHRAIFCDTGWEAPETYEYLGVIERTLGITIERVRGKRTMQDNVRLGRTPSRLNPWCTVELKVEPFDRRAKEIAGDAELLVALGIRADESEARAAMPELEYSEDRDLFAWRPLLRWPVEDVLRTHHRHGLPVNPLYARGHSRVGCFPCKHSTSEDLRLIAQHAPWRIEELEALEASGTAAREAKNAATPSHYKKTRATFFQKLVRDDEGARHGAPDPIRERVERVRGRQLPLFEPPPAAVAFAGDCASGRQRRTNSVHRRAAVRTAAGPCRRGQPVTGSVAPLAPEHLARIRRWLGLPQEGMARLLCVTCASVNRWERGRYSPSGLDLEVYRALDVARRKGATAAQVLGTDPAAPGVMLYRIFRSAYARTKEDTK